MKFCHSSGAVELPTLGLRVPAGEEFEATGQDAKNLEANPAFERTDKPKPSEKE